MTEQPVPASDDPAPEDPSPERPTTDEPLDPLQQPAAGGSLDDDEPAQGEGAPDSW